MASSQDTPPAKRKRLPYTQKYTDKWEKNPKFSPWLTKSDKGPLYFHCKLCRSDGKAGKSEIERHAIGKNHMFHVNSMKGTASVANMPSVSGKTKLEKKVQESEIRLAGVVSELNLPFTTVDTLVSAIKAICPDSEIAKSLRCGKTKCKMMIKNVLGKRSQDDLHELLKSQPFSLIVDESTDRGCIKHLALVVRVLTEKGVKDCFLSLVPLESATASILFQHIKTVFTEANIPYKENLIGFAADGANVMMGKNNSLSMLLKEEIPSLFVMKCICHSFHLCSSYACQKLPRSVEDLARDVYNYFQSPKQSSMLKEFQEFVNIKPHKILHVCQTRWLSLHSVVKRLLEQLPALKLFFVQAALNDRLLAAETILAKLNDPLNKLYLEFLDFVLPIFSDLNKEMQAEEPKIYNLCNRVSSVLSTIFDCYLKPSYLKSTHVSKVNVNNPSNFLPLEEIYLGGKVAISLQMSHDISKDQLHYFRLRCLDFYIEGASQIIRRFNIMDPVLTNLNALDPQSILEKSLPSIAPLASHFPNLVPQENVIDLDREWRLLRNTSLKLENDKSAWSFWKAVKEMKKGDDSPLFPLLGKFMTSLLCLPHSSACVERVFSQINLMKTKQRNSLSTSSLIGMLHAKRIFDDSSSSSFQITENYINLMGEGMYDEN